MRTAVKTVVTITLLLLFSSLFLLPAEESSADGFSIELLDEDGSKLDPSTPMIKKLLVFTTYTDEHGTRYYLDKETILTEKDYYLRINSQTGLFNVYVSVPSASITGSLHESGMEVRLAEGTEDYLSVLDTTDDFSSIAKDGQNDAVFRPNVMYRITILTAHDIEGDSQVEKTPDFTLRFEAVPINSYTVVFMNDGEEYAKKLVEKNTALGELPKDPEKPGYTFNGWFDEDMNPVTEETIVTRNMEVHSEWSRASTCTVTFYDRGAEFAKKTVKPDTALGTLPDEPTREGWTFDGWFDDNGNRVTEKTIVERDMNVHSRWSQDPPVPPGPTPPKPPHDKETKEEEVIVEPDGTVITIISDLIERVDGTYDL